MALIISRVDIGTLIQQGFGQHGQIQGCCNVKANQVINSHLFNKLITLVRQDFSLCQ